MSLSRQRVIDVGWWTWSGIVGVAILALSLGAPPDVPGFHFEAADKVGHLLAYGVLTGSLLLAAVWRPGRGRGVLASPWPVIGGVIVFGGVIELIQSGTGRNADVIDLIADALGVFAATGMWVVLRRRFGASDTSASERD